MSRPKTLLIAGAAMAAIGLGALTTAAYAQAQPRPEPRRVERDVRIERDGDVVRVERGGDRMMVMRHGRKDQAEHLKNILQLRPNQEAALATYLEAMKPKMRTERLDAREERPDSTPEKLARMEQRLAERQAAERARIDAVKRFYAQLDERQKKAFDELPLMMGPGFVGPGRAMRIHMPDFDGFPFNGEHFEHFEHIAPPPPPAPPSPPSL